MSKYASKREKKKYQRDICKVCMRPFTPEQIEAKRIERKQNMENSRAKARANGTPLGRKRRGDRVLISKLRTEGYSIRAIARASGVSVSAVARALKELGQTGSYVHGKEFVEALELKEK